jgi:O-antigen/teichoic acid export membrane protein
VFLSRVGAVTLNNNEPLIAAVILGPTTAAVLGVTDRVFKMCQMIVNQVAAAAYYGLAHLKGEEQDGARVRAVTDEVLRLGSAVSSVIFAVAVLLNGPFIALWVGPDKFGGVRLNILLACASLFAVRANLYGVVLASLGGNAAAAWCQLGELAVRVPLVLGLTAAFGGVGLPLAVIVTSCCVGLPGYAVLLRRWLGAGAPRFPRLVTVGATTLVAAIATSLALLGVAQHVTAWWHVCAAAIASAGVFTSMALVLDRSVHATLGLVLAPALKLGHVTHGPA